MAGKFKTGQLGLKLLKLVVESGRAAGVCRDHMVTEEARERPKKSDCSTTHSGGNESIPANDNSPLWERINLFMRDMPS